MQKETSENISGPELKSFLGIEDRKRDKIALFITNVFGSLSFLVFCVAFFTFWICWNLGILPNSKPFDPYPFPGLEMVVSIFAIILSVSVLISQKRQGRRQKINQQVEFEVNIRAENEITQVLRMLHNIQEKLGISGTDEHLEAMKQDLNLEEIHKKMDEFEK